MTVGSAVVIRGLRPRGRGRHLRFQPVDTSAERPAPRAVATPYDAARVAADWLGYLAFGETIVPRNHPGVVYSERGMARIDVGGEVLSRQRARRICRPAAALGRYVVLFSVAGFTPSARRWADRRRVALFHLSARGVPEPVGMVATRLLDGADARAVSGRR